MPVRSLVWRWMSTVQAQSQTAGKVVLLPRHRKPQLHDIPNDTSGIKRNSLWWILLLGLCILCRGMTASRHSSHSCTRWRWWSGMSSSWLFWHTDAYTRQLCCTLLRKSIHQSSAVEAHQRLGSASTSSLVVRGTCCLTIGDAAEHHVGVINIWVTVQITSATQDLVLIQHKFYWIRAYLDCYPISSVILGNSLDKLRHPRSVAYSVELVLLNKHQISGGGAYPDCYRHSFHKSPVVSVQWLAISDTIIDLFTYLLSNPTTKRHAVESIRLRAGSIVSG